MRFLLPLLILLAACQPATLHDLRLEAAAEARRLAERLHSIDTRDQLEAALPDVERHFTRIAKLAVKARDLAGETPPPSEAADQLFAELARLYEMPGCRSAIERAQQAGRDLLSQLQKSTTTENR